MKQNLDLPEAVCWSTDAPFRETASLLSSFVNKGATHVDMECAAIYAFAEFYKTDALCVIVAADSLVGNQWHPPTDMKTLNSEFRNIVFRLLAINHGK
ncbi:phosphorylase family protein [Flavobacterium sp. 3HN19-14]|uniref:phosphorylase family protein n=1 Tax=Flavobacterium sp. 3HN19-14 TaxID=3448133 RepID=UPI003EE09AB3